MRIGANHEFVGADLRVRPDEIYATRMERQKKKTLDSRFRGNDRRGLFRSIPARRPE